MIKLKLLAAVAALMIAAQPAVAHQTLPDTYVVSRDPGVLPEGIAVTGDGTIYVTSYGTGAVYRGTVREPKLKPFLPAGSDGRTRAAGVHLDRRGRIFVAGFDSGALFVYSPCGELLAKRVVPTGSALNDLVITKDAVYVTDSRTGVLWRASLSGSRVGELTRFLGPEDFPVVPGFLNGIVATPDGRTLLVADGGTGSGEPGDDHLIRVDVRKRTATEVKVTGGLLGASDGMVLEGNRLYGVVDLPADATGTNPSAVNLGILNPGLTAAHVVRQSGTAPRIQTPTTIARDPAGRLLWVNSQLGNPSPKAPFTVTVVPGLR